MHKTKVVPPESDVQASCGAWRGREAADPVDYKHPYPSMAQYAELLALRFDAKRTRHAYYGAMRVLHEHFQCDPATLEETHLRNYLLHIKLHKRPSSQEGNPACLGSSRKVRMGTIRFGSFAWQAPRTPRARTKRRARGW